MRFLKLILVGLLTFSMVGCSSKKEDEPVDKSGYNYIDDTLVAVPADMSGYEGFTDANPIYKKITFSQALRFFDEKATGVIYFGYSTCPYCIQVAPLLNEIAKGYDLTVYYVDVHGSDPISEEDIDRYLTLADDVLEHEDGEAVFYVPQVLVLVNGEIVGNHIGAVDSYDPSAGSLSSSQRKELTGILEDILKPVR